MSCASFSAHKAADSSRVEFGWCINAESSPSFVSQLKYCFNFDVAIIHVNDRRDGPVPWSKTELNFINVFHDKVLSVSDNVFTLTLAANRQYFTISLF